MLKPHACLLALVAALVLVPAGRADSFWERRTRNAGFLFVDNRARQVGDLLTIAINESTDVEQREQRNLNKQTQTALQWSFIGGTQGNVGTRTSQATLQNQTNTTRQLVGEADYISNRQFLDRMMVTVVEVLPNGNLVIEGSRQRFVAGEQRTLLITGVVRPYDIGPNNIIESQYIANFQATYKGKGIESHFTHHNWLGVIFNTLWPF